VTLAFFARTSNGSDGVAWVRFREGTVEIEDRGTVTV